jgi:hypothetical protein
MGHANKNIQDIGTWKYEIGKSELETRIWKQEIRYWNYETKTVN